MELITIAVVVIHLSSKCFATPFLHNSRVQDSRPTEMRDTEFFVNVIRQDINNLNKNIENLHHSQSSSICNDIQKQMTFHSDLLKLMNVRITRLIRFLVKDEKFEDTSSTEPTPEDTLPSRNLGSFITAKLLGIKRRLNLDDNYIDPVGNVSPYINNNVDERKVTDNKQVNQEENENLETTTDYFPLGFPQNPFASMFKMETTTSRQNILKKFNECKYR